MFEAFILASNYYRISKRFGIITPIDPSIYNPSYKIIPETTSFIIRSNRTKTIEPATFGLKGLKSNKQGILPFVRAEGKRNLSDDPNYTGSKAIFLEPEFKSLIRSQRCIVIADAFIVKSENKANLFYLRDKKRPFAFAGLWNISKEDETTFAILTTTANPLIAKLGHKRMPVILHVEHENRWLRRSTELSEVLAVLNPYPDFLMNAYPVDINLVESEDNNISIIQPIGSSIILERKDYLSRKKKKIFRDKSQNPTLAERAGIKP